MGGISHSYRLANPPCVVSHAAIVGPKEGEGPLASWFDEVSWDDTFGESSFEKGECQLLIRTVKKAMGKGNVNADQISFMLAGDLLNQIISASFAARQIKSPFLGMYGACSTMAESLAVGAMLMSGGMGEHVICTTASHFSTAERQYRLPLEMGCQRPPTAQRTVTASGATLLGRTGGNVIIPWVTLGQVIDLGIDDANHMGAAMAPAAADPVMHHFEETGRKVEDYDLIVTGDLGETGRMILEELLADGGYTVGGKLMDCGAEIYRGLDKVDSGGSGCGCSAAVLNGMLLTQLEAGEYERILFAATGALLSTTSMQQKETIPGIAHAVVLERRDACGIS